MKGSVAFVSAAMLGLVITAASIHIVEGSFSPSASEDEEGQHYTYREEIYRLDGFDFKINEGLLFDVYYENLHTELQTLSIERNVLYYGVSERDYSYLIELTRDERAWNILDVEYQVVMLTEEDLKKYSREYSEYFNDSIEVLQGDYDEVVEGLIKRYSGSRNYKRVLDREATEVIEDEG